jgi:hypothetical protein
MLSSLRLTFDQSTDVIRLGDGFINLAMNTDNPLPEYSVAIALTVSQNPVDFHSPTALFAFVDSAEKDDVFSLIAEGQSPAIPSHYRILSLVRALEVLLPQSSDRTAWLDQHQSIFEGRGLSPRQFRNALPELRDRCAHGSIRSGERPIAGAYGGIAGLDGWLEVLRQVVFKLAAERFGLEQIAPLGFKIPQR